MEPTVDLEQLAAAWTTVQDDLRQHGTIVDAAGSQRWEGELSSSALSTATAISALSVVQSLLPSSGQSNAFAAAAAGTNYEQIETLIFEGLNWLADQQNEDGGWGDTDKSFSNIATTMLVRAAFQLNGVPLDHDDLADRADAYIEQEGGVAGLRHRYGKDKTFAIPILANCALAGMVDWREVSPLPFEMACLPQSWYRFLRLPVVSYAIPALVAVGQARHFFAPSWNPLARLIRNASRKKSLQVLEAMQPASGGYLEAIPLTSFVVMCLAGMDLADNPVLRNGIRFLLNTVRPDGSWPIDTNLATWLTTLSVNALDAGNAEIGDLNCRDWILGCQQKQPHPFTGAEPGGWGWTDLSGGVPDADDTASALLALAALDRADDQQNSIDAARAGIDWLLALQNNDSGWPTFCRGWGRLPFDRSGTDLTAHVLRAFDKWRGTLTVGGAAADVPRLMQIDTASRRGFQYLDQQQHPDGCWLPLWFGNQNRAGDTNPVYGTGRVLLAYAACGRLNSLPARRGFDWLVSEQHPDGSWGAKNETEGDSQGFISSVEETAIAVEALLQLPDDVVTSPQRNAAIQGVNWLCSMVEQDRHRECSPIGFYFAKLWYYERLYPVIFSTAALGSATRRWLPEIEIIPTPPAASSSGDVNCSATAPPLRT